MSDPIRLLLSAETTEMERKLLLSWTDERPTVSALHSTLVLVELPVGLFRNVQWRHH